MRGRNMSVFLLSILSFGTIALARAELIEGLVNIKFQLDARTFAVLATINAAGFELDAERLDENPVRKLVRGRLSSLAPELCERLRHFYDLHNRERDDFAQQSRYASFSLLLSGPPEFSLSITPDEIPADAKPLIGFEKLVRDLWKEGELPKLWNEVRPHYLREIQSYRSPIRTMILRCLRYTRIEARVALDRKVIFIPDLLNGYGIVNARNVGTDYFVLVGPTRRSAKSIRAVRHEYLHFVVDPLIEKYAALQPETEPFLEIVRQRAKYRPRYEHNFSLMLTESLIHMMEIRLDRMAEDDGKERMIADFEEGLILAPHFLEALEKFEATDESLYEFIPKMFKEIKLSREQGRPEKIAGLKIEIDDQRSKAESRAKRQKRARAEAYELLVRANELMSASEFDEAKELLQKVLLLDCRNAGALFGMAQLAAQEQDLDRALELYGQAAAEADERQWIKAWCRVRRGNIYRLLGNVPQARSEWSKVLEIEGDVRGAREAATKALAVEPY